MLCNCVCESGYYLDGNECIICPLGSYCANNIKTACDTGYNTDNTGASTESQCYTTCEQRCTQQTCPDNATCTHGATTTTGKQYVGGTCDASASQCELTVNCATGYELTNGTCSAIVCESGYYLDGNECEICPAGTTSFAGASGIEQCVGVKTLHIGDEIQMNLTTAKPQTARVMVFDVLGDLYYGGLSETAKPINKNTDKQFRIYDPESNQNYWMHDYTVQ